MQTFPSLEYPVAFVGSQYQEETLAVAIAVGIGVAIGIGVGVGVAVAVHEGPVVEVEEIN
ncbi:hypothetical protein [Alteromonas gilva]|uniref:Uncharacterized protein n=1 Tax=Alteromonas gilva TaxID=2987522 RepID=A0ABT5L9S1_9ALTE|nr:hypothetical protein [Alteromonas gilva]MDC8832897.1 hypothetical protein [Alteromonas gilva]